MDDYNEQDFKKVDHPNKTLDIMCVANLGMWSSAKGYASPQNFQDASKKNKIYDKYNNGVCYTSYLSFNKSDENQLENFEPIGSMLAKLIQMLSWQYPELRRIAHYIMNTYLAGSGKGIMRLWPLEKLSTVTQLKF